MLPWLVYARAQFAHGSSPFWVGGVGFSTLSGVVLQFFSGPSIDAGVPGQVVLDALQGLVVVLGCVSVAALVVRRRSLGTEVRHTVSFLLWCSLAAMALLVVISVWHPLVEARYASVMWGPLVCVVGVGFSVDRVAPRRGHRP